MHGVHAIGRQHEAGGVHVCRWKPKLVAEAVAANHLSSERPGSPEHLPGGIEIAGLYRFANARAADRLAVERDRSHAVDGESKLGSEFFQQSDVAGSFVAEG